MSQFPNLFIIGAMKAGTSSLHEYLNRHPEIFMGNPGGKGAMKEVSYFAPHYTDLGVPWGEGHEQPGLDWYLELFSSAGKVKYAGEASVLYSARPWIEGCEKRIHRFNSAARIVYILRDPVERAISHYWYSVRGGLETLPILSAMKRSKEYVDRSDYAMQLKPYVETFGFNQVFVLTLEELHNDSNQILTQLFEWLGVDSSISIDTTEKVNVGKAVIRQTRHGLARLDLMMKHWRWKQLEPKLPGFVPRLLQSITYRQVHKESVDTQPAKNYLRPILQQRTEELVHLLGREFPCWSTLYPLQDSIQTETQLGVTP